MPDQLGPYRLDEELGRGAMGIVYRAFDPGIGRTVAIKVIRTQHFSATELAELNVRFAREAAAAGKLAHPNIVTIYQLGQESGAQYMAMEFVAGASLEHKLPAGTQMATATALSILSQMADALDYAHDEGVVHRDVKPANVIVRPDGRIKVTDFGIARMAAQTMTQTGITMGTPSYMAPEQILGSRVDGKADQFSLAIIAYRMLSGRKPFDADSSQAILYQTVHEHPPALNVVNANLPPACAAAVGRGLSKDPAQRYPTCSAFIQDLRESFVAKPVKPSLEEQLVPKFVQPPPQSKAFSLRTIAVAAATGAMLAAVIAGLIYYSSGPRHTPSASETRPKPETAAAARTPETNPTPPSRDGDAHSHAVAHDGSTAASQAPLRGRAAETAPPAAPDARAEARAATPSTVPGSRGPESAAGVSRGKTSTHPLAKINPKDGQVYRWISPGSFMMGCSPGDTDCQANENPPRSVTISKNYWIGQTLVTQAAYRRVAGEYSEGGSQIGDDLPAQGRTWTEARAYCRAIGGRLPTEAEWEYAARAGSTQGRYGDLNLIAWFAGNSNDAVHPVKEMLPNGWGLYDILGNLWEWTADWYNDQLPSGLDPAGPATGAYRSMRGGSFMNAGWTIRLSSRTYLPTDIRRSWAGFRCVAD